MTIEVSSFGMAVHTIILLGMLVGYRQLTDREPSLLTLLAGLIISYALAVPIVLWVVGLVS